MAQRCVDHVSAALTVDSYYGKDLPFGTNRKLNGTHRRYAARVVGTICSGWRLWMASCNANARLGGGMQVP
jgi:hypothetical protein